MKVIIAGSRTIDDYAIIEKAIRDSEWLFNEIVSGGANGVDRLGERYAKEHNKTLRVFKANWNKYGRGAGPIRNQEMADYADGLIAIWDGKSRGTQDMIERANKKHLPVYVFKVNNEN